MAIGTMTRFGCAACRQRACMQAGLGRLQLAAVAAPALGIEEEVVRPQHLGDVGLERDEVGRVLGVAADRNRAGDVAVDEAERTAEQVDAGGDDRRPDARCRRAPAARPGSRCGSCGSRRRRAGGRRAVAASASVDVLVVALDLAQDRIERMLQRPIELVALRGPQLVEVALDPLPGFVAAQAVTAVEVARDLVAGEDGLRDLVGHRHDGLD